MTGRDAPMTVEEWTAPAVPRRKTLATATKTKLQPLGDRVVVRRLRGQWMAAAIRPAGRKRDLWALPKGNIGPDEKPEAAALRAEGRLHSGEANG